MTVTSPAQTPLSMRHIVRTWWPLAASWLLMTAELSLMSAVIARLAASAINLAAWGVVFALSIIIQAPSTMLLAASTALSKDWDSYLKMHRFMLGISAFLTALHALIAFTPLYYVVVGGLIGAPAEIIEPARLGLMIMVPWSWGTAYRRFQQGVLIRFGHSQAIVWGSLIRLSIDSLMLMTGYMLGVIPGVIVATSAIIIGVLSEAIYTGLRVRPILRHQLKPAAPVEPTLTSRAFLDFYIPLAITTLLTMLVQPLVSAALSRMPNALESLAVWPVLFGFLLMWQSVGIAYNEAVITLLDRPYAVRGLQRFTVLLVTLTTVLLLIMVATPLATLWFKQVTVITPSLVALTRQALWLGLLLPGLRVLQSWYQGAITYSRQTRGITESIVVFLLTSGVILWAGVAWGQAAGIYVSMLAFVTGFLTQTGWLWQRSRPVIQAVHARDAADASLQTAKASVY
jgi:hypothetical protein